MQPNIWNYQPPELKVGRPQYFQNPLGLLDVTDYVPPSESKDEEYDRANDPDGQYDGNPGYANDGSNMPTIADAMGKIFGLTDFAESLDRIGQINSGSEGVDPDPTAGDDTFGLGISP